MFESTPGSTFQKALRYDGINQSFEDWGIQSYIEHKEVNRMEYCEGASKHARMECDKFSTNSYVSYSNSLGAKYDFSFHRVT